MTLPASTASLLAAPPAVRPIEWVGDAASGFLRLIDQTRLPGEFVHRDCRTVDEVWRAIRELAVRGAPAIGVAAAFGVVLGAQSGGALPASAHLRTSRPTAVNLFWALDRMDRLSATGASADALLTEARAIQEEDAEMCRAIGRHGASLVTEGEGVLTHCNAGGLATAAYGTALAILYAAAEQGKQFGVFVDETRPLLQGARLTAWELSRSGLDVTLICDNMAAQVMKEGRVRMVIVGADRIAANGDAANKIGTYAVALLAAAHDIPFYVAAPSSTFDLSIPDGSHIPIEQRDGAEVTHGFGRTTAPEGVRVYNPAFDVTPARLITAIVTERGLIEPVNETNVRRVIGG